VFVRILVAGRGIGVTVKLAVGAIGVFVRVLVGVTVSVGVLVREGVALIGRSTGALDGGGGGVGGKPLYSTAPMSHCEPTGRASCISSVGGQFAPVTGTTSITGLPPRGGLVCSGEPR